MNAIDNDGDTPLIGACYGGQLGVVKELLKHCKVDLAIVNKKGQTALDVARATGQHDIVNCLVYIEVLWSSSGLCHNHEIDVVPIVDAFRKQIRSESQLVLDYKLQLVLNYKLQSVSELVLLVLMRGPVSSLNSTT